MLHTDFSCWPSFTQEEADAVAKVLLSNKVNYWTGTECRAFEKEFASWSCAKHAVALANGTVALDNALNGFAIGAGDEVVVTPRTFLASASTIVNTGAVPVFADVDRTSQNITAETVSHVLTPRTKAIICVHHAGWPCEMDLLLALAQEHSLYVIEDCAQAHGAVYKGRPVGAIGHVGAWSFCQDKIITTGGEGGMVTTNDSDLWAKMWSYKDHGKSWKTVYEKEHAPGFRWLHESFGTNWRLTEIQAAIGRIQLQRMPVWHAKRKYNAQILIENLSGLSSLRIPLPPEYVEHAWYKFYGFVRPAALKSNWSRDRIMAEINRRKVPCTVGSCSEVYLEKAFDYTGFRPKERLPAAKELGETSLMFLVHPTLKEDEMSRMVSVIRDVVLSATR